MADNKKTIAILGATGQQGGSVVEAFLQDQSKYQVRGLTRDTASVKSKKLAEKGVEVVQADLYDADSLKRAFEGAHIIYAMTDFWQSMSATVEYEQGKRVADVAADLPGLEHFVWASLPDGKGLSKGKYANIFHWQSKADVTKYIKESKPDLWSKTIELLFPNYFENCLTNAPVYLPAKHEDGTYVRTFVLKGDTPLPNAYIADTGKLVKYLAERGDEYRKRSVVFNSQSISEQAKLDVLAQTYNIPVRYQQMSEQEFRSNLEAKMGEVTALDFAEQLMIFEGCGMIYDDPSFVQASQLPGLQLTQWEDFVKMHDLLSLMPKA